MADDPTLIPRESYASTAGELRALARVVRLALGVLIDYWKESGLHNQHAYLRAAYIIDGYLRKRYQ